MCAHLKYLNIQAKMLFQFICTVFLLYISVQKSGGECVRKDEKLSYLALKYDNKTEIRFQMKDICSKVEQLQLEEIRLELNRPSELQNDVINKLNQLNEKFSKVTDLESKISSQLKGEFKDSATKQTCQNDLLNDVMGKMNDLNENLNKITSLESKIDELSEKFNKSISLQPIQFPSSCDNVQAVNRRSGIRQIVVPGYSLQPIEVSCDDDMQAGDWTTVLRRQDGNVDFFLFWEDYKKGFGTLTGEFFIGLQKLHFMTKAADQELLITMDFKAQRMFAIYDRFAIGDIIRVRISQHGIKTTIRMTLPIVLKRLREPGGTIIATKGTIYLPILEA